MTATPKTTPAQRRTLTAIADNLVTSGMDQTPMYDAGIDDYGTPQFVTLRWDVVDRLVAGGLVVKRTASLAEGYRSTVVDDVYKVTALGRAVLGR